MCVHFKIVQDLELGISTVSVLKDLVKIDNSTIPTLVHKTKISTYMK